MAEKEKILIAEEDYFVRELLECALDEEGYQTVPVIDGNDLVSWVLNGGKADLALIDTRMPSLDGVSALQQIRSWEEKNQEPRLKTIIVSDLIGEEFEPYRERIDRLAQSCLHKPFNLLELLTEVRRLLEETKAA